MIHKIQAKKQKKREAADRTHIIKNYWCCVSIIHNLRARTCYSSGCNILHNTQSFLLQRSHGPCYFGLLNSMTKMWKSYAYHCFTCICILRMDSNDLEHFSDNNHALLQHLLGLFPCQDIAIILEKETQNWRGTRDLKIQTRMHSLPCGLCQQSLCVILNVQKWKLTTVLATDFCDNQPALWTTKINNFPKRKDFCREQSSSKQNLHQY